MSQLKTILLALTISLSLSWSATYTTYDGTFVDSQGQSAKYRIGIPNDYVPGTPAAILIHLHGNNTGTQDDMLNMWYNTTQSRADARGLIPIVIASPGTRTDGVTRQWSEAKDPQMLDELLQSHFQNKIKVDFNKVYLWGASQGTCFINAFLLAKADNYLGGALGNCGCFNYLSNNFDPSQSFIDNYRFYILGTTEDFLYEPSKNGYQFYRWTAGLKNIRGDLSRPGAHCTAPSSAVDSALSWIVGDISIPETPDEIHWQRISTLDSVRSLDINSYNQLIVATSKGGNSQVSISEDQGDSWINAISLNGETITSAIGTSSGGIAVLTGSKYYRYDKDYQLLDQASETFTNFLEDGMGNLYKIGGSNSMEVSIDGGVTWAATGFGAASKTIDGQDFVDEGNSNILVSGGWKSYSLTDKLGSDAAITLPVSNLSGYDFSKHNGKILFFGWDGADNWKPYAWTSADDGATWSAVTLPAEFTIGYTGYGIRFNHDGSLIFHGPSSTKISNDNGATWIAETNLGNLDDPYFTKDQDGIVYTSGGVGVFRKQTWLNSASRPTHTTGDKPDVTTVLQNVSDAIQYTRAGDLLILEAKEEISVEALNLNGQSKVLYQGNPQGKMMVDLSIVPRGHLIRIQSSEQQGQFLR